MKKKTLLLLGAGAVALYLLSKQRAAGGANASQDSSPAPQPITQYPENPPTYQNVVQNDVVTTLFGGGTAWSSVPNINIENLRGGLFSGFQRPSGAPSQQALGQYQATVAKQFATMNYDTAIAWLQEYLNPLKSADAQMYATRYYGAYYALGGV